MPYKKAVFIITNSADLHVDLAEAKIAELGTSCFRLNLDAFPKDYKLSIESSRQHTYERLTHLPSGKTIDLGSIGSVWLRKKADFCFLSDDLSIQERQFACNESDHILKSILFSLDCYWLSHPSALNQAGWKIEQSKRAHRMGFSVPDSLVTNEPGRVQSFYCKHPQGIVTKAMSSPTLGSTEVKQQDVEVALMATTLITDDMMRGIDGVKEFPTYFQAYIDKAFELRVTIIANDVFAACVNSQDSELTKIDSRSMFADIEYTYFALPDEITSRCVRFVKSYGLEYGAIDLIVTPDGEYVFLENNPVGQFLYVEQLVPELKMMDCLVNKLVDEAQCRS